MHYPYLSPSQSLHRLALHAALLLGGLAVLAGVLGASTVTQISLPDSGDSAVSGEIAAVPVADHATANERSTALIESREAQAVTVAHVAPADRAIALLEGNDPENAGVGFVITPATTTASLAAQGDSVDINFCIPCDGLA